MPDASSPVGLFGESREIGSPGRARLSRGPHIGLPRRRELAHRPTLSSRGPHPRNFRHRDARNWPTPSSRGPQGRGDPGGALDCFGLRPRNDAVVASWRCGAQEGSYRGRRCGGVCRRVPFMVDPASRRHFMPVVLRCNGARVLSYSNEGNPREPVHIHAVRDGIDAKFWLNPVRVAYNDGLDPRTLRELQYVIEANAAKIEWAWRGYFR